jgi:hypothetical protein
VSIEIMDKKAEAKRLKKERRELRKEIKNLKKNLEHSRMMESENLDDKGKILEENSECLENKKKLERKREEKEGLNLKRSRLLREIIELKAQKGQLKGSLF